MWEKSKMRFFALSVLVIALISFYFTLNSMKRLNDVKRGFEVTKSELTEVKGKFKAYQESQWPKFYNVNGKLLFKPGGNRLIIDHEEIPGVMPPMIMSYEVEDPRQIKGLEPGNRVHFKLKETADKLFIINIEKAK
jgi:copper binding protein CusF